MTAAAASSRQRQAFADFWIRLPVAAVDLAWLSPCTWLAVTLAGADGARAALSGGILYLLALATSFIANRAALPKRAGRLLPLALAPAWVLLTLWATLYADTPLGGAAWLLAALAAIRDTPFHLPPDLVLLILAAILYWRGLWLGLAECGHGSARASFQTGLVAVAAVALLAGEREAPTSLALTLAYLVVALPALSVARGLEAGRGGAGVARLWGGAFTGILLLMAAGLVFLGGWLAPALVAAGWALLNALLAALHAFMMWLVSLFGSGSPAVLPEEEALLLRRQTGEAVRYLFQVPELVGRVGRLAVVAAFLLPMVYAVLAYLAEVWRRLGEPLYLAERSAEPAEGKGGLWQALRKLIFRLGWLLWRGAGGRALDGDPRTWAVRLAYRDLLRAAQKRGATRRPATTPAQQLPLLLGVFPGHREDLVAITRAYEAARYGPPPGRAEVAEVRARLRRVLRRRWFGRRGGQDRLPRLADGPRAAVTAMGLSAVKGLVGAGDESQHGFVVEGDSAGDPQAYGDAAVRRAEVGKGE